MWTRFVLGLVEEWDFKSTSGDVLLSLPEGGEQKIALLPGTFIHPPSLNT